MLKRLFGKKLFGHKKPTSMYDFAQHGLLSQNNYQMGMIANVVDSQMADINGETPKKKKKVKKKKVMTPKKLYELESLNDNDFNINTEAKYITKEVKNAKKKLGLIYGNRRDIDSNMPQMSDGSQYGKIELESIIVRLENRRRVDEFSDIIKEYPHTSSALINDVVKEHSNLRCKLSSEFIPDMPEEAVNIMNEYNEMCEELTGLKTHFYVIADRKDFGENDRKRDPILLAQSPFGFFWQILGAWDEEMVFLGDL